MLDSDEFVVVTGVYPTYWLSTIVLPAICDPDPKAEFKLESVVDSYAVLLTFTLPDIETDPFLNYKICIWVVYLLVIFAISMMNWL